MAYEPRNLGTAAAAELIGLWKQELRMCNLQPGELCIVVTDTAYNPVIADACLGAALDTGAEAYKMTLPHTYPLPSRSLCEAWKAADLIVYPTTHGLHSRQEMREALDSGTRALMTVQPLQVLRRMVADSDVIRRTKAGAKMVEAARTIRITSEMGTDLFMDKTGRPGVANYGAADEPGHLDFWGSGMVEFAQLEGTLEGQLVLNTGDICFHLGRYIDRPVTITFREGRAVKFEGDVDAFIIENHLKSFNDPNALTAGHTSWGTDPRALWSGLAIQFPDSGAGGGDSEAHYGQVEIEIGSNNDILFKGKNATKAHLGLCSLNCSLWLDDKQIIDHGEFVPEELRKR
ncbi:MAG TPA: hypothetical protein DEP84_17645 [Chloroflexi bacterium]|nr:hypothetical protein [Chloroflexota bacterium]